MMPLPLDLIPLVKMSLSGDDVTPEEDPPPKTSAHSASWALVLLACTNLCVDLFHSNLN